MPKTLKSDLSVNDESLPLINNQGARSFRQVCNKITRYSLGAAVLAGIGYGLYALHQAVQAKLNTDDAPPQQSICSGIWAGNITCPIMSPDEPANILQPKHALNSYIALHNLCCPPIIPSLGNCCGSNYYNYTIWNFRLKIDDLVCHVTGILADSKEDAASHGQDYFNKGTAITGYDGTGVACRDALKPTDPQSCIYSPDNTIPSYDPDFRSAYEVIAMSCRPSFFKNGSATIFANNATLSNVTNPERNDALNDVLVSVTNHIKKQK